MADRDELKPCAHCGDTRVPRHQNNGIGDVWLECFGCGCGTGLHEENELAAAAWNRRTPSDQSGNGEAVAQMSGDERDAFESYMLEECMRDLQELSTNEHGEYDDDEIEASWQTWKYRASQPSNAEQDAPTLTAERIDWIANSHCATGVAYPIHVKKAINQALRESAATVPQVVQAPDYDADLLNKLPSDVIEAERVISGYFNSTDGKHWALGGIQKRAAAPIVATVPSEQMEAEMWNRALEAAAIICDTSSLQPAIATRIRALKHATPSPTEQASDVRNAALACLDQRYEDPGADRDMLIHNNACNDCYNAVLKSATPADKGNAPVEAKL